MIQDTAWSPRFVPSTTATAATSGEAIAGTDTTKFITPSLLPAATSYHAGPVVNGRAPRQGLVFDGTTGSSGTLGSIPSGTWTVSAVIDVPTSNPAANIMALTMGLGYGVAGGGSFVLGDINTSGNLTISQWAGTFPAYREATISGFRAAYSGKRVHLAAVVTGAALTVYINGVATSYTEASGAGAPAWGATLGSANVFVGKGQSAIYYFSGGIYAPLIYNRALSASEVVALYESGAPAGADYNSASNTSKLTGANSDFSSAGNWTVTGSTTISGGKLNLSNGDQAYCTPGNISVPVGGKFRVTLTVDSITAGSVQVYTGGIGGWVNIATTAGTFTQEFTFSAASGPTPNLNLKSTGGNAVVDTVLFYQIGLLLAPDAAQAGGGLVWYDTSGNAANISWTSGVSWNVPTAGRGIFAAGTNAAPSISFANDPDTGFYNPAGNEIGISVAGVKVGILAKSASDLRFYGGSVLNYLSLGAVGDISLVAAGTNQNITLTPSGTGNVVADAGFILNRVNAKGIYTGTSDNCGFTWTGTNGEFSTASGSLILKSAGTTALTLDSSQTATFANHIKLGSGKVIYFDGGINTYIQGSSGALFIGTNGASAISIDSSQNATFAGAVRINGNVGFYNQAPVAKPTGVAVTAAAIHAALVTLNLISA